MKSGLTVERDLPAVFSLLREGGGVLKAVLIPAYNGVHCLKSGLTWFTGGLLNLQGGYCFKSDLPAYKGEHWFDY